MSGEDANRSGELEDVQTSGLLAHVSETDVVHDDVETERLAGIASSSADSVLREKIVEHVFLGQLLRLIWSEGIRDIEVLKPEVDRAGYDLVIAVNGIVRHIQLKAMRKGGKRSRVDLSTRLTERRGGCVIWLVVDEDSFELGPFYWLGSEPHLPLVLNNDRVGRHTKGNAQGEKLERPMMRTLNRGDFARYESMSELRSALFG